MFAFFICGRQCLVRHCGTAGCVEENWSNLSLDETSALSLPLDKDMSDAVLVGLEFDLTSTELFHHTSASIEGVHLPPCIRRDLNGLTSSQHQANTSLGHGNTFPGSDDGGRSDTDSHANRYDAGVIQ